MKIKKTYILSILLIFITVFTVFISLKESFALSQTSIMGSSQTSKDEMIKYFQNNNNVKTYDYINNFVTITIEEANYEGVRADVVFIQMMKETNFLKFTGIAQESWNNFGGLGVTGEPGVGETFPDIRMGIRAVIQHLKAYASSSPLNRPINNSPWEASQPTGYADGRYNYVIPKGKAPYIEMLGNGNWATDPNYGSDIVNRLNTMDSLIVLPMLLNVDSPRNGGTVRGNISISGWALNDRGISKVEILNSNGSLWTNASTGLSRTDVSSVLPGYPNGDLCGYAASIDTRTLPNGINTILVKATGNNGQQLIQGITVLVDNAPKMFIETPNGKTVRGNATISGWALNAWDIYTVDILKTDGSWLGPATTGLSRTDVNAIIPGYLNGDKSGFSGTFDTRSLPNGLNTILVRATGKTGQQKIQSTTIFVDNGPKLTIDSPNGTTVRGTVTVSGWALNAWDIYTVDILKINGSWLGGATTGLLRTDVNAAYPGYLNGDKSGFSGTFDSRLLPNGVNTILVRATGKTGQQLIQSATFVVDNNPKMNIDYPRSAVVRGTANISGWALNAWGIYSVDVLKTDGTWLGGATTGLSRTDVNAAYPGYLNGDKSGFSGTFETKTLPNGWNTILVRATGKNGQQIIQSTMVFVDNTPKLCIETPAYGSVVKGTTTIAGWALNAWDIYTVDILNTDGSWLGGATTGVARPDVNNAYPGYLNGDKSGYYFNLDTTTLSNGLNTILVRATGKTGQQIMYSLNLYVNNAPPAMFIDSPTNEFVIKRGKTFTISGWAINASGVKAVQILRADGSWLGNAIYGFDRPDINFSGYKDVTKSGYAFELNTGALPIGRQAIIVRATGNNGEQISQFFVVNVAKTTIVLDPGHGGYDPGAVQNGLNEKDVNLGVALILRDFLNSRGYDVLMTRDTDIYLSLQSIADISNASGGDIFVSLHADSSSNTSATGSMGTYYHYGYGWATDNYNPVADANWQLNLDLANKLAYNVALTTGQNQRASESHSFGVLWRNNLPATLVEMGFLSNPSTAGQMATYPWRYNAAAGIANGIDSYFANHP